MNITKHHVGRKVLVEWNDIGKFEGLLVGVESSVYNIKGKNFTRTYGKVFFPYDCSLDSVEADQIVEIGKLIEFGK